MSARPPRLIASVGWMDVCVALGVAVAALAVYLPTMFPDVGGGGDPIKFQYLGQVLGTAHPPGYPLYVLVSHAFSYLPIGTPAYRMNLLSVTCGVAGVSLAYGMCRVIGAGRVAAGGAALALAFSRDYWDKSLVAEVYALNAALVAGIALVLMVWGRAGRRAAAFYGAVALFALATGNHLTVVAMVPALVVYVLWTDWRAAVAPRRLAATIAILALGVAQYLFIILRTHQNAAYVEARAETLVDLIGVIRADRYADQIGAFAAGDLWTTRLWDVAQAVGTGLGWLGVAAAAVGLLVLTRRHPREAVLVAGGAAGVFVLTINVDADIYGFLLPVYVLITPLVAFGLQALASLPAGPARRWLVPAAAAAVAVAPLAANHASNDHSRRTYERRFGEAIFEALPARAALVQESYAADALIRYFLAAEGAARGREILLVPPDPELVLRLQDEGYEVFAFEAGREILSRSAFQFEPARLFDAPLWTQIGEFRPDWRIVIAAPRGTLRDWPEDQRGLIQAPGETMPDSWWRWAGVVLTSPDGAIAQDFESTAAQMAWSGDDAGRDFFDGDVRVESGSGEATIDVDGDVYTTDGAGVLAAVFAGGQLVQVMRADPTHGLRTAFPDETLERFTGALTCVPFGNLGWVDVTPAFGDEGVRVRVDNYRPFDTRVEIYVVAGSPVDTSAAIDAPRPARLSVERIDPDQLPPDVAAQLGPVAPGAMVFRLTVEVNDDGQFATIDWAPRAPVVAAVGRASVDLDNPQRATACESSGTTDSAGLR